jgi:hypothetical protein
LDFFISFAAPDIAWARWIGWTLEDAGYRVLCQEQDMRPGHNAVHQMQLGTAAARTLAVFSPDYFGRPYPESEWSAAYVADPVGIGRKLIPVMVRPCHPPGLLRAIVYIDLVGVSRPAARRRLRPPEVGDSHGL